jgi:hypothetical protein
MPPTPDCGRRQRFGLQSFLRSHAAARQHVPAAGTKVDAWSAPRSRSDLQRSAQRGHAYVDWPAPSPIGTYANPRVPQPVSTFIITGMGGSLATGFPGERSVRQRGRARGAPALRAAPIARCLLPCGAHRIFLARAACRISALAECLPDVPALERTGQIRADA